MLLGSSALPKSIWIEHTYCLGWVMMLSFCWGRGWPCKVPREFLFSYQCLSLFFGASAILAVNILNILLPLFDVQ